MDKEQKEVFVS